MLVEDNKKENLDAVEVATFFGKYKNYIYGAVILIVGALGGNVDRVGEVANALFPEAQELQVLDERVGDLELRVEKVEQDLYTPVLRENKSDNRLPIEK